MISKYALDNVKYNETYPSVTWETSTIRSWLNNDFYNKAFRNADKSLIVQSYLENKNNADYNTKGGNSTYDKMFLLSIEEANKYFSSDVTRAASATPYAEGKGARTISYLKKNHYNIWKDDFPKWKAAGIPDSSCWWWLRSPGGPQDRAAGVRTDGYVVSYGNDVFYDDGAVRVAFKINLKSL